MKSQMLKKRALQIAVFALVLIAIAALVDPVWAASADAMEEAAKKVNQDGWRRGVGMEICPIKLAILAIVYFFWVATTSWTNNDAERLGDPDQSKWNGWSLIAFAIGTLAALFIPIFWVGLGVLVLAWWIPLIRYILYRNKGMLDADKVMTPSHLAFWFRTRVLKQKVKPKKMAYEAGSPIQLEATGELSEREILSRTVNARNHNGSFGYNNLRELLYHALHARATDVLIDFTADEAKFQYQIDGVYHPVEDAFKKPWEPDVVADVPQTIRILIGADPNARRARLSGLVKLLYDKNKKGKPLTCEAKVEIAPTQTGEKILFTFKFKSASFHSLTELGVAAERQDQIRRLINADSGLVVLATSPHQGLKTLTTVMFNTADRFTRDFSGVEDEQHPYEVIENISTTKYDSAKGQTPMDVLPDVFFREPKVLLIRDMVNLESWKLCCEEVKNDRLIITTFRGADAVSTIIGILKSGLDASILADALTAVITQRLVRRLCNECKEEIDTPRNLVQQWGMREKIFRKRVHEPVEPGQRDFYVPCDECRDIGYFGRIAIFDILEINDEMRQIIASGDPLEKKNQALRRAVAKSGQKGYMEDGIRIVNFGVTSLEEVQRALK